MSLLFLSNLISTHTHTSRQAGRHTRTLSSIRYTYSYLQTHTLTQQLIEPHAQSRVVDTHRLSLYAHPTPEPFHSPHPTAVSVQRTKYQYKGSSIQASLTTPPIYSSTTLRITSLSLSTTHPHLVHKPLPTHTELLSLPRTHQPMRLYAHTKP